MQIIRHRVNTLEKLGQVDTKHGIEVDVRYHENTLVAHHDPFHHHEKSPIELESLIKEYRCEGPVILNVKTEGIEDACIDLLRRHTGIEWFFLDLSMPYFVRYALRAQSGEIEGFGPDNLAVRFSEWEPKAYALGFSGMARWVWVDCFTTLPLDRETAQAFADSFKICLVSPELQGHDKARISQFKTQLQGIHVDAVCTKYPELWV